MICSSLGIPSIAKWAVASKVKRNSPSMTNVPGSHVDEILNDLADAPPLYISANRHIVFTQTFLSHHTEQIVVKQARMCFIKLNSLALSLENPCFYQLQLEKDDA